MESGISSANEFSTLSTCAAAKTAATLGGGLLALSATGLVLNSGPYGGLYLVLMTCLALVCAAAFSPRFSRQLVPTKANIDNTPLPLVLPCLLVGSLAWLSFVGAQAPDPYLGRVMENLICVFVVAFMGAAVLLCCFAVAFGIRAIYRAYLPQCQVQMSTTPSRADPDTDSDVDPDTVLDV